MTKWTLVQHSAYGYAEKPGFFHAVEERSVDTKKDADRVLKAGGVLFDSYMAASDAAFEANYPPGNGGIYPRVRGTFATTKVDGLRVFVPAAESVTT